MVATRLAHLFGCEQVAVGMLEKGSIVLRGISHSARFDARTSMARGLEELMQECVEFQVVVETPAADGSAFPAHQHFSELNQLHLFTVPLRCEDQIVGALLLQRRGRGLSEAEKKQVHKIGHFLGALFEALFVIAVR